MLCVRHSKTNYTEVFPDLTVEGIKHVRNFTNPRVKHWMTEHDIEPAKLDVISSPAQRARGTAALITSAIDPNILVTAQNGIDAMKWRDKERCFDACKGLLGKGYIDYETESIFADPKLFETPDEVRVRWYTFFSRYIKTAMDSESPRPVILVSHYEVLCNITRDLFGIIASKETALGHGECIALSIYSSRNPHEVYLSGVFRGHEVDMIFDLSTQQLYPA